MEDWLKCQISPLVNYRQNKKQNPINNMYAFCVKFWYNDIFQKH